MGQVSSTSPGKRPRHRNLAQTEPAVPSVEPVAQPVHHHGHAPYAVPEVPTDPQYRQEHKAH
jgi:hypothetical protein